MHGCAANFAVSRKDAQMISDDTEDKDRGAEHVAAQVPSAPEDLGDGSAVIL